MNKQDSIKIINSFKSQIGLKNKRYSKENLLALQQFVLNNKKELSDEQTEILINFIKLAKTKKTLNISIIDEIYHKEKKNILDYLFKNKEIIIKDAKDVKVDNKFVTLNEQQLDELYNRALKENMSFEAIGYMEHRDVKNFFEDFVDDRTSMYMDDGQDEDDARWQAEEDADNIDDEADSYVYYFLDDLSSKYSRKFKIKGIDDSNNILFVVKDKLSNLLGDKKFSEVNEPVLADDEVSYKIKLFKE